MWSEFLADLKDAAGASGTPPMTSMPSPVSCFDREGFRDVEDKRYIHVFSA